MEPSENVDRTLHDVRISRPVAERRMLVLAGRTTEYSFSPVDEFVIGSIYDAPLVVRRQRERHVLIPGESCVWDPEHAHSGSAPAGAWSAELVIVPASELFETIEGTPSQECRPGRLVDVGARRRVAALHRAVRSGDRLAIETELTLIARSMFVRRSTRSVPKSAAARRRLTVARDLLVDRLAENVSLAELATAAGMDRFHFVREFKAGFGQPPHAYRLHLRLLGAQRELERGRPVAEVAAAAGFFDQSHLHRHFRRRFGLSPARYAAAFARSADDTLTNADPRPKTPPLPVVASPRSEPRATSA